MDLIAVGILGLLAGFGLAALFAKHLMHNCKCADAYARGFNDAMDIGAREVSIDIDDDITVPRIAPISTLIGLLALALLPSVVGCALDVTPDVVDVSSRQEDLRLRLACTSSTQRTRALDQVLWHFGGEPSECWEIQLQGGVTAWRCGAHDLYFPNRETGWFETYERYYTQVTPIGPTIATGPDAYAVVQYTRCGDGRIGAPGEGQRWPSQTPCVTEGWFTCRCSDIYWACELDLAE